MKFSYKYGFFILLFFSTFAFSQVENKEIFIIAEEIPRFPGCEDMGSIYDKSDCAYKKFMEYIDSNIKYPKKAIFYGIEGRITLRFVVNTDSTISNIEILRDIGGGCGEEAKRVIESMNKMSQKWIPGRQRGKNVNVWFTTPIFFKLKDEIKKLPESEIKYFKLDKDTVFLENDELPLFPGAKINPEYYNYYNNFKLLEYINSKIIFPEDGSLEKGPRDASVQFLITKTGEIKDIKVLEEYGYGSGEEVVILLNNMINFTGKWKPATYKGDTIDSYVKFFFIFPEYKKKLYDKFRSEIVLDTCEKMPIFPGCKKMKNQKKREECSQRMMLDYLRSQVGYPCEAKKMGLEGKVTLKFVVFADGIVDNIEIFNDIGGGCGDAVYRAIKSLPYYLGKWTPGKQRGKKVNVSFIIHFVFKLNNDLEYSNSQMTKNHVFVSPKSSFACNHDPIFPLCRNLSTVSEMAECTPIKMLEFIYSNIKYPPTAASQGIEGRVVLKFRVNIIGKIDNVEIVEDIGGGCGEEAKRALLMSNELPTNWMYGIKDAEPIDSIMTVNVIFKLNG